MLNVKSYIYILYVAPIEWCIVKKKGKIGNVRLHPIIFQSPPFLFQITNLNKPCENKLLIN